MDLAAYLSYCFVMRFTPGPNNLMSLAQSRERTFRGALPFLLGLHVSLFSMCTVIYLFIHEMCIRDRCNNDRNTQTAS